MPKFSATLPNATKKPLRKRKNSKQASSGQESNQKNNIIFAEPLPEAINVEEAQEVIFRPNPGPQTEFLAATEQECLYGGAAGGGKIVWDYQSVLTPKGWKNCKELRVGDEICDPLGGTQTIEHLFGWEELPVWEVEFDDGTVFDTSEEHLWSYHIARDGKKRAKVASTREMAEHMESRDRAAIVPTTKPVTFEDRPVSLDPYLMGCLLGDGCFTTKSVSYTSHEKDWPHYSKFFGGAEVKIKGQTIRFVGETRKKIVESLTDYGLLGLKSSQKFVPEDYLVNSSDVRKELLRGLMDTDGYRDPQRARAEFCSVSKDLNDAVRFLAQSLGYRIATHTKIGSYCNDVGQRVECQKVYRTYITGYDVDDIFKLPRKKTGVKGKQLGRRVLRVNKETGRKARGRCITVSSDHSLYITDDFVVTHNSYAMLADPVRYLDNPNSKMLLLRRTTEELRELISVSKTLYPRAIPGIKWLERDKTWVAPSGATLWMSYLDNDDDVLRYQGQAYNWIGFDELTQWRTPFAWDYMRSRLRTSANTGLKLFQRATTNPGGPGHSWVKKAFIDPATPGKPFWAVDPETGEVLAFPPGHSRAGEPLLKRRFIPANLFDNPYLAEDGMYEANLLSLPEVQRKQLLEGSWDLNEGAAFPEFNRKIHVTEAFDIPDSWVKFRACDYGYGSFTGVLWFAVVPRSEQLIVYRELYVSKVTASDLADMILEIEGGDRIRYGVLDSSLWHKRGDTGPSLAEQMIKKGCRWRPSDRSSGSRVAGKNEIHRRLQVDKFSEEPGLIIFDTCTSLISQLPSLPLDRKNPEDVDTKSEDHLYDALRYGIMSRPRDNRETSAPKTYRPVDSRFGY